LAKHRFGKLFSTEEANRLIPRLEIIVRELQLEANLLRARIKQLVATDPAIDGLRLPEITRRHPELKTVTAKMAELAARIEAFGCVLKDIDQGLIDFPFEADGDVAFLCWQFGEQRIIAWHSIEGGFSGRRLLPGAPKTYLN
jgi:hypothetical protein